MNNIFNKEPKAAAKDLLGKILVFGSTEATILSAQGYPAEENTGIYEPVLDMQPGEVYCPRQRNAILILIVTKDGGCILIRTIEIGGQIYKGPGKTSQALGLEDPRVSGSTTWHDGDTLVIQIDGQPQPTKRDRSGRVSDKNGIGEATLRKLMPKIIGKYLKDKPGVPFEQFLNGLLEMAADERAMRRALR